MQKLKCISLLVACVAVAPVCANAILGDKVTEEIAERAIASETNINAAKAKFDAYIQANYGNTFSCGVRLATPDETLMHRYRSGELRQVARFGTTLKVTDYTPIYGLAKQKARPAVVSHTYYIEDE
ncbi:hypothetical protein [Pseudidiomarina sp.]|uniref:hypothetical protein n=1 Tax=Pseudidiomarina sp. TaxID=2081707 RepID=UPI003A9810FC